MSASMSSKPGPVINDTVEEVQAIFPSDAALQDAIARLTTAGFDRAALSLPTATPSAATATPEQGAENPNTDTDQRQMRTLHASMAGSVGAMAAAGVVIATGGAALPAVAAAVAAGAGAGALAHGAERAADNIEHEGREQAAAQGDLVLAVNVSDATSQANAEQAMRAAGATRVEAVRRRSGVIDTSASR